MARVALALLGRHPLGLVNREAGLLPGEDAAFDVGNVVIAELLLEEMGGPGGASAGAAVEDQPPGGVRCALVGGQLGDLDRRHQDVALEMGFGVLVGLADVEQDDVAVGVLDLLEGLLGRELLDLLLDLLEAQGSGLHQSSSSSSVSSSTSTVPSKGSPRSSQSLAPPIRERTPSTP